MIIKNEFLMKNIKKEILTIKNRGEKFKYEWLAERERESEWGQ